MRKKYTWVMRCKAISCLAPLGKLFSFWVGLVDAVYFARGEVLDWLDDVDYPTEGRSTSTGQGVPFFSISSPTPCQHRRPADPAPPFFGVSVLHLPRSLHLLGVWGLAPIVPSEARRHTRRTCGGVGRFVFQISPLCVYSFNLLIF